MSFRFTAVIKTLPSYTFRVRQDGSGSFDETITGPDGSLDETKSDFVITGKTVTSIFEQAKVVEKGGFVCAGKMKGIADTGVKVLGFDGKSCTYNSPADKTVSELTETFQAMAETLAEGRRLAFKHRYDRLGLNDEMTNLWEAVKAGRAIEVGTISGTLRGLVEDGDVLERVRVRAAELLKMGAGG